MENENQNTQAPEISESEIMKIRRDKFAELKKQKSF